MNSGRSSPSTIRFNPVLGFLSVSTDELDTASYTRSSFNPVLGFLSVSTLLTAVEGYEHLFQSRAGFSECLDRG